ncbi:MAG TPA: hypothetical protein P5168_00690 [Candidatus Methanomethylicus sp.]|nr:hypothetical protein [Candidatus Methanomethylicus sp.]HRU81044.1 hypothetical protein [Candidatus Methanomethylicus sp.]
MDLFAQSLRPVWHRLNALRNESRFSTNLLIGYMLGTRIMVGPAVRPTKEVAVNDKRI